MTAEYLQRRGRDATLLTIASVVAGIGAYAYVVLGTRHYGSRAFAPVGVLWSLWSAEASVVTFPIQHWIVRGLHIDPTGARLRRELVGVAMAVTSLAVVLGAAAALWRHSVFHRGSFVYPALVALVTVGMAGVGASRGLLAGRGRFRETALSIAIENLLRVAAGVVVVAASGGVPAFAVALLAGFAVALFWPTAFRLAPWQAGATRERFAADFGGLVGASFVGQVLLSAAPVIVAVLGGSDREVTATFAAFALARAPMVVAVFVSVMLTAEFARWVAIGRLDLIRRVTGLTAAATVAASAAATLAAWAIGRSVLHVVFGRTVDTTRLVVATIALGCTVALGVLVLTLLLVVQRRSGSAFAATVLGVVVGAVSLAFVGHGAPARVGIAFAVSQVTTFAVMVAIAVSVHPPRE